MLRQRTLVDALQEVKAWLDGHAGEFVVLYLDDQMDLAQWVSSLSTASGTRGHVLPVTSGMVQHERIQL